MKELLAPRAVFGETLVELARTDPRIVVLCADLTESLRLEAFRSEFPDRFFELGVAEQNMMGVAAGLALAGRIPFVASFAVFNPGRNWDQLRVSVCYAQANVKIIGGHAGLSVGPDGATHQALEDLAITRSLPNLVVLAPTDGPDTAAAVRAAAEHEGPVYIRFGRDEVATCTTGTSFKIGAAQLLREGRDLLLCACGPMVSVCLAAANTLALQGIDCAVMAMPSIKPLDSESLIKLAQKTGAVLTVEDHQAIGGLGSAVAEVLGEAYPVPVFRLGVQDQFGQSGTTQELYDHYGLNELAVVSAALKLRKMKNQHVY